MGRLRKFWSLTRREKEFFCEAGILLLLSNLCVRTIAFKHIDNFLRSRWNNGIQRACNQADDIRLAKLSLSRMARLLPWKNLCLSRSIAAFVMLRRRGIPAVLVAGVKLSENSTLVAHAWVQTGHGVIDGIPDNYGFTAVVRIGQEPLIADLIGTPLD